MSQHVVQSADSMTEKFASMPEVQLGLIQRQTDRFSYEPTWMKPSTIKIENSHNRFHKEILDFGDWVRVKDTEPYQNFFEKVK